MGQSFILKLIGLKLFPQGISRIKHLAWKESLEELQGLLNLLSLHGRGTLTLQPLISRERITAKLVQTLA